MFNHLYSDPALDDKEYSGTKVLMEAKPLPNQVRVVDAMYSDENRASQVSGDVITELKVATQLNSNTKQREKVCM